MRFLVLRPLFDQVVALNPAQQLASAHHLFGTTAAALQQQRYANFHMPAAVHCAKQQANRTAIPTGSRLKAK
jgi:hypothetical protein